MEPLQPSVTPHRGENFMCEESKSDCLQRACVMYIGSLGGWHRVSSSLQIATIGSVLKRVGSHLGMGCKPHPLRNSPGMHLTSLYPAIAWLSR